MKNFIKFIAALILFAVPIIKPFIPTRLEATYNSILIPVSVIAFIIYEYYLIWHLTISKEELYDKLDIFDSILQTSKEKMLETINRLNPANPLYNNDLRLNIMIPVTRKILPGRQRMRIFFYSDTYTEDEKKTYWYKGKKGSGTCGEAWNLCSTVIFDSSNSDYRRPKDRLNGKQKAVDRLMRINSVLSFPIMAVRKNRIIGVLNLDSDLNIDRTLFNDGNVIRLGMKEARLLACVLPDRKVSE